MKPRVEHSCSGTGSARGLTCDSTEESHSPTRRFCRADFSRLNRKQRLPRYARRWNRVWISWPETKSWAGSRKGDAGRVPVYGPRWGFQSADTWAAVRSSQENACTARAPRQQKREQQETTGADAGPPEVKYVQIEHHPRTTKSRRLMALQSPAKSNYWLCWLRAALAAALAS